MLENLRAKVGSRTPRKRLGRGIGSGLGKTSGRGQKGAGARAGYKHRAWSEGGQMPIARRLPKHGFHNPFRVERQVVNVCDLAARFEAGASVDAEALERAGLVSHTDKPVKVLADGEISIALSLRVDAISAAARQKIESAGGRVELPAPAPRRGRGKRA